MAFLYIFCFLLPFLLRYSPSADATPIYALGVPISTASDGSSTSAGTLSVLDGLRITVSEPVQRPAVAVAPQIHAEYSKTMDTGGSPFDSNNPPKQKPIPVRTVGTSIMDVVIKLTAIVLSSVLLFLYFVDLTSRLCNRLQKERAETDQKAGKALLMLLRYKCGQLGLPFKPKHSTNRGAPREERVTQSIDGVAQSEREMPQHDGPPPEYLPSEWESLAAMGPTRPPKTWQPHHHRSYEIELGLSSIYSNRASALSRSHSTTSDSAWTDCSVTELSSAYTSIYTSRVPLPSNSVLISKSENGNVPDTKGHVEKQVKQLNQRASKLSLKPIQTPWLQPEILSPKETTKSLQFKSTVVAKII